MNVQEILYSCTREVRRVTKPNYFVGVLTGGNKIPVWNCKSKQPRGTHEHSTRLEAFFCITDTYKHLVSEKDKKRVVVYDTLVRLNNREQ